MPADNSYRAITLMEMALPPVGEGAHTLCELSKQARQALGVKPGFVVQGVLQRSTPSERWCAVQSSLAASYMFCSPYAKALTRTASAQLLPTSGDQV